MKLKFASFVIAFTLIISVAIQFWPVAVPTYCQVQTEGFDGTSLYLHPPEWHCGIENYDSAMSISRGDMRIWRKYQETGVYQRPLCIFGSSPGCLATIDIQQDCGLILCGFEMRPTYRTLEEVKPYYDILWHE